MPLPIYSYPGTTLDSRLRQDDPDVPSECLANLRAMHCRWLERADRRAQSATLECLREGDYFAGSGGKGPNEPVWHMELNVKPLYAANLLDAYLRPLSYLYAASPTRKLGKNEAEEKAQSAFAQERIWNRGHLGNFDLSMASLERSIRLHGTVALQPVYRPSPNAARDARAMFRGVGSVGSDSPRKPPDLSRDGIEPVVYLPHQFEVLPNALDPTQADACVLLLPQDPYAPAYARDIQYGFYYDSVYFGMIYDWQFISMHSKVESFSKGAHPGAHAGAQELQTQRLSAGTPGDVSGLVARASQADAGGVKVVPHNIPRFPVIFARNSDSGGTFWSYGFGGARFAENLIETARQIREYLYAARLSRGQPVVIGVFAETPSMGPDSIWNITPSPNTRAEILKSGADLAGMLDSCKLCVEMLGRSVGLPAQVSLVEDSSSKEQSGRAILALRIQLTEDSAYRQQLMFGVEQEYHIVAAQVYGVARSIPAPPLELTNIVYVSPQIEPTQAETQTDVEFQLKHRMISRREGARRMNPGLTPDQIDEQLKAADEDAKAEAAAQPEPPATPPAPPSSDPAPGAPESPST